MEEEEVVVVVGDVVVEDVDVGGRAEMIGVVIVAVVVNAATATPILPSVQDSIPWNDISSPV